jgi:uncharacterized protein YjbI with pentapeptide repeats
MNTERHVRAGRPVSPLTRADVELLRSNGEGSARLDLSFQNLQHCDLSYMDLQGANLRGANLQGANLRGTNLSDADLQEAHLRYADLDGADLSHAHLGDSEANRVNLHHAKLRYAALRELDLRGFDLAGLDLQNADLSGSDLRDALLLGTNLQGADLSTAQLRGPELQGAKLYRDELSGDRSKRTHQGTTTHKELASGGPIFTQERSSSMQGHETKQIKKTLADREAYVLGEHALKAGSDPVKLRRLFPRGFGFATARQLFDAWLVQAGDSYHEQEIQAMWIGFAHRICDLYHEDEPEE